MSVYPGHGLTRVAKGGGWSTWYHKSAGRLSGILDAGYFDAARWGNIAVGDYIHVHAADAIAILVFAEIKSGRVVVEQLGGAAMLPVKVAA